MAEKTISNLKLLLQYDPKYKDLRFKNNTTIGAYGCAVMATAMVVARLIETLDKIKLTEKDILQVVTDTVKTGTNQNGDFTYAGANGVAPMTIMGKQYVCTHVGDAKAEVLKDCPVVIQVRNDVTRWSHYVVLSAVDPDIKDIGQYKLLDPGFKTQKLSDLFKVAKVSGIDTDIKRKFIITRKA
jgi:hypothetical protein